RRPGGSCADSSGPTPGRSNGIDGLRCHGSLRPSYGAVHTVLVRDKPRATRTIPTSSFRALFAHGCETVIMADTVLAAGAVAWRRSGDHVELLMIHRPRYDDWTFPKGKVDRGERLPQTAVREVEEETGIRVRLGVPLVTHEYK